MRGDRRAALFAAALAMLAAAPRARADGSLAASDPAIAAIRFYQRHLSSLRHGRCRFVPSCSEYAAQAIAHDGVIEGSARAADRLMRCNASAPGSYPRAKDGRLEDPVDPPEGADRALHLPAWLSIAREPDLPPVAPDLDPARRARLEETVTFACRLRDRGDAERAATEFQRAASLAGDPAADAWAFARIGECELTGARWAEADRAFLTAGMLARTDEGRARAAYRAATSRFSAGAFTSCARLLEDPVLAAKDSLPRSGLRASGAGSPDRAANGVTRDRVVTLGGLCALGRGAWDEAASDFARAAAIAPDDERRNRILRLAPFAARGPRLPHRSPVLASALSAVVPGSGQMLCGRAQDGVRHLIVDAALAWTVVSFAHDHRWPAVYITAGVGLPFYLGNVIGAGDAARAFDRERRLGLVRESLRESAR